MAIGLRQDGVPPVAAQVERVHFHPEQIKWLEKMFPEILHTPNSTPAEMYYSSGMRRVVEAVRSKVQR